MNKKIIICLILFFIMGYTNAVSILTGPIYYSANGHYYYLLDDSTWVNAENKAQELGGHLVTINDSAEDSFVFNTFKNIGGVARSLWIGLNDAQVEGSWVWASGEAITYTHWNTGEPNNYNNEDYGMYFPLGDTYGRDGTWNDAQGTAILYGIVESTIAIPESNTIFLISFAILSLAFLKKK